MKRRTLLLLVNLYLLVSTAIIAGQGIFFGAGQGQVGTDVIGLGYFKPFTMDSNILSGIAALVLLAYLFPHRNDAEYRIPFRVEVLHLMASGSLMLTFVTAACFLAPIEVMQGRSWTVMFQGDMFFFHLLNPLLSFVSFTLLQKDHRMQKRCCFFGLIPAFLYSIVYLFMVVIWKQWEDFYNFTFGGRYELVPVVMLVIYSLVTLLSLLLVVLHNSGILRKKRKM